MKKILNKKFIFTLLAFALLLTFSSLTFAPKFAHAANYTGDYICISQEPFSNGRIAWSLDFGLNTEAKGLKEEEKGTYRVNIQLMVQKLYEAKRAEIEKIYAENPVEEFKPQDCIRVSIPVYVQDKDSVGFSFIYQSAEVFDFYNSKPTDINKVSDNLFLKIQVKKIIFPFAERLQVEGVTMNLATYYRNLFIKACEGLSIESTIAQIYDPQFIFDYANYSNKVKSNADLTYTNAGKFHHAWGERLSGVNENIIVSRSLTTPHRGWWYLFAIIVPLACMGIAILVIVIKNKKDGRKEKQENKEIVVDGDVNEKIERTNQNNELSSQKGNNETAQENSADKLATDNSKTTSQEDDDNHGDIQKTQEKQVADKENNEKKA